MVKGIYKWRICKLNSGRYLIYKEDVSSQESHNVDTREEAVKLKKELNDVIILENKFKIKKADYFNQSENDVYVELTDSCGNIFFGLLMLKKDASSEVSE